ncbi:CopD family protein [Helicobacter cetorum]|uniref:Protoporphyrinogen IX oxidase n=1 Tax=Helicobacter cetorum (strain ATCC BAA-429 / MIT 00-7128) TaxID=182217 RepID=I0EMC5_HELC0|nr:CopD family protein [Helicobacter cetorum]AFI04094.1 hypothetical protein HCW_04125 [Helicobacter cetorum MIT 00-7128]
MREIIGAYYLWVLSFHIIGFVLWSAMLLILPRLFSIHKESLNNQELCVILEKLELFIYRYIGSLGVILVFIMGGLLLYLNPSLLNERFFQAKLVAVGLLTYYSHTLGYYRKRIYKVNARFFKAYHLVALALIGLIVSYILLKNVSVIFSVGVLGLMGLLIAGIYYKNKPHK